MKILHVINSLGSGGAERSLAEMLPGFLRAGIVSTVAVFRQHDNDFSNAVIEAGGTVHVLNGGGRVRQFFALRRLVREVRPDIIHTTLFEADVLGRMSGAGRDVPVVTSLINTAYGACRNDDRSLPTSKRELVRRIDGCTARHLGTEFHAITRAVRDDAVATMGLDPAHIAVIPRGRAETRLGEWSEERRRRARSELGVDDSTFLVVNVGRQEFQKGQSILLEAIGELLGSGVDLRLVIAGRDGNETAHLRDLVDQLGLEQVTRFVGLVDNVPDLLVAADALAFPSRFEGMAGTVVEALALGTPIIASDVPALREVLEDGRLGILVPAEDPRALAAALDEIRRNPEDARARSEAGRVAFRENYTIDQVTAAMVEWFEQVHRSHGGNADHARGAGRSSTTRRRAGYSQRSGVAASRARYSSSSGCRSYPSRLS